MLVVFSKSLVFETVAKQMSTVDVLLPLNYEQRFALEARKYSTNVKFDGMLGAEQQAIFANKKKKCAPIAVHWERMKLHRRIGLFRVSRCKDLDVLGLRSVRHRIPVNRFIVDAKFRFEIRSKLLGKLRRNILIISSAFGV